MNFTLEEVDNYLDEKLDKMGSDYFPLPIKYEEFKEATYDLIRESTKFIEGSQEISDDILPLVVRVPSVNMIYDSSSNIFKIDLTSINPLYHRLIEVIPFKEGVQVCKKPKIIKTGQNVAYSRDPYKEATEDYPLIERVDDTVLVNLGNNSNLSSFYTTAQLTYVKQPTFASIEDLTERIVDLPNTSIYKIINRTHNSLRVKKDDPGFTPNYNFDQTFGKKNR